MSPGYHSKKQLDHAHSGKFPTKVLQSRRRRPSLFNRHSLPGARIRLIAASRDQGTIDRIIFY
jgi:hypothetical protein